MLSGSLSLRASRTALCSSATETGRTIEATRVRFNCEWMSLTDVARVRPRASCDAGLNPGAAYRTVPPAAVGIAMTPNYDVAGEKS